MGTGSLTLLVGAAISRSLLRRWGAGRVLLLTNTLLGAAFLTLTTAGSGDHGWTLLAVTASHALSGVTLPLTNLAVMTLIPKIAPSRVLGRVIGAALPLVWGANALGPLLGGTVAAATTPTTALLLSTLLTAAAVTAILTGRLHRIHHSPSTTPRPSRTWASGRCGTATPLTSAWETTRQSPTAKQQRVGGTFASSGSPRSAPREARTGPLPHSRSLSPSVVLSHRAARPDGTLAWRRSRAGRQLGGNWPRLRRCP